MSKDDSSSLTKLQKSTPASLLKQLRATAAMVCYDHLFAMPTMPLQELQRKLFNMYHGNEELNIVSQVELMCDGKGTFSHMYNIIQTVVTNTDHEANTETGAQNGSSRSLILHPSLFEYESHIQYTSGLHFNAAMLKSSTKKLNEDNKCSGRFLLDLCKQTIANIKKATIIADQWLINNDKPSGTNWDDLYSHILENYEKINPKERVFTGFANFLCHTKYNDRHENLLNILSKNDEDAVHGADASRSSSRKSTKSEKDRIRAIHSGDPKMFNHRGFSIDSRMQMVEIAQFNDAQRMEAINHTLGHLTNRNKLLLDERLQQINLAKIICPKYDAENEHWIKVTSITNDIERLKKDMRTEELKKIEEMKSLSGNNMAEFFLASVTSPDIDSDEKQKKSPCKRSVCDSIGHEKCDITTESPTKKIGLIDKNAESDTSLTNSVS